MGYRKVLNFEITDSLCTAFLCICNDEEGICEFREVFKFKNTLVEFNDYKYCDILNIFTNVKKGMIKAYRELGDAPDSISISASGAEYGLIDKYGCLLESPYNESDNKKIVEKIKRFIKSSDILSITGSDIMQESSMVRLMGLNDKRPYIIENTRTFLLLSDLINFMLTGEKFAEYTNSYFTQLVSYESHNWADRIISVLGLKKGIFPALTDSQTLELLPEIQNETLCIGSKLKISGSFLSDTSIILKKFPDSVIINNGIESNVCILCDKPLLNKYELEIRNTAVFGNKFFAMHRENNLTDKIMKCFNERNISCNYSSLRNTAMTAIPLQCFINPDDEIFDTENIPVAIQDYCSNTNQYIPQDISEMMRCVYESIAFRYALTIEKMTAITGNSYSYICMTGKDSKNEIICQILADVCGIKVISGIEKSNVYGNFILQLADEYGMEKAVDMVLPDDKFKIFTPNEDRSGVLSTYCSFCLSI